MPFYVMAYCALHIMRHALKERYIPPMEGNVSNLKNCSARRCTLPHAHSIYRHRKAQITAMARERLSVFLQWHASGRR